MDTWAIMCSSFVLVAKSLKIIEIVVLEGKMVRNSLDTQNAAECAGSRRKRSSLGPIRGVWAIMCCFNYVVDVGAKKSQNSRGFGEERGLGNYV